MMKKWISALVALCLLLACFVTPASAEIIVGDGGTYTTDESPSSVSNPSSASTGGNAASGSASTDNEIVIDDSQMIFDADSAVATGSEAPSAGSSTGTASEEDGVIIIDDNDFVFDADSQTSTSSQDAEEELHVYGVFTYVEGENGITITGYTSDGSTDVEIPGTINGLRVVAIGANVFANTRIQTITIPDSVVSIGASAFDGCTGLTTVRYIGTKRQWESIEIGSGNDPLRNADIQWAANPMGLWAIIALCAVLLLVLLVALGSKYLSHRKRSDPDHAP